MDGRISYEVYTPYGTTSLAGRPTYVHIHGFNNSPSIGAHRLLRDALRERYGYDSNIILVNWSDLAGGKKNKGNPIVPDSEASITTEVGERIGASLLAAKIDPSSLTLIGHSLGTFVASAAAAYIKNTRGSLIKDLVSLDTAFGPYGYDTDARNGVVLEKTASAPFGPRVSLPAPGFSGQTTRGIQDYPLFFKGLAQRSTSYVVSDLDGILGAAGDNSRSATADINYLIQYDSLDSTYRDYMMPTAYHQGVVAVYADLIRKSNEYQNSYWQIPYQNFNNKGQRDPNGKFHGVILAPKPVKQDGSEWNTNYPGATGWLRSTSEKSGLGSQLYGTSSDDYLFYDGITAGWDFTNGASAEPMSIFGGYGNDMLIGGAQRKSIDYMNGNQGADYFCIGYREEWNKPVRPYLDKTSSGGFGTGAMAVVRDFNVAEKDKLIFEWKPNELFYKDVSAFDKSIASTYGGGRDGVAFMLPSNSDIIAFIPGLSSSQVPALISQWQILFAGNSPIVNNQLGQYASIA